MEENSTLRSRFKNAWNAFFNKDPTPNVRWDYGASYGIRPDRVVLSRRNERTIVAAIYNRIAADAAQIEVKHVRLDDNGRFKEEINDGLNNCLTLEANLDQTGRAFIQDVVMSMLDEGVVAVVPIDTDENPEKTDSWDILTMRVGRIVEWYPEHIRVECYDERDGQKKERIWPKEFCAIIENPFYAVMNERNSTMQRLIRKLALLDVVDQRNGSDRLDLIIQMPFDVKSEVKRRQADERRKDIVDQLATSPLGIAYTGASEHITQLNRAVENNLLHQIEYLTTLLFSQLGITQGILDGTADATTMMNYNNRIIEPIMAAITDEMKRKFLTKTARTQKQSIEYFRDPFRLIPTEQLAELADKLTRNEIVSTNEVRQIIGMKPSNDPAADELRNKNLSQPGGMGMESMAEPTEGEEGDMAQSDDDIVSQLLSNLETQITEIIENAAGEDEPEEDDDG